MTFYPIPRAQVPLPPGLSSRPRFFYFFSTYLFALPLARQGARSGAKDGPKCPKGAKKERKSSLSRAKSVTFRCQIAESGPLLKHQQGLCFHHIMRVRAPPFSLPKSTPEHTVHRECSFSLFYAHFRRQSDARGRPKGAPREPKGPKRAPKPPPGRLKTIKKSTWDPTWAPGGARVAPGVPPGGKIYQKRLKHITLSSPLRVKKWRA